MEVEMEEPQADPDLQPQAEVGTLKTPKTPTKDQSCQTDEQQQLVGGPSPPDTASCGHSTPVLCVEPGDPALLQQQLQTSKPGIQQIIECFRSGTAQLRHMLLREVDTIFECRLCRSLFRGLPNLITHREHYCLPRRPQHQDPPGDDKQSAAIKDLLEAIYPRRDRPDYVVRLEPIQTSSQAVFQYASSEEELAQYQQQTPSTSRRHSPEPWGAEKQDPTPENQDQQGTERGAEPEQEGGAGAGEEAEAEAQPEEEGSTSGVDDVTISCCLCGKDFNSRRSVRRHCRKMHQTKLEELRKYTETRTVPISLLSMVKGRPRTLTTPTGKSCPVCYKSFATKANVRRHFDEVHRGLRRDDITPDIATRPGQPLSLEATPPRRGSATAAAGSSSSPPTRTPRATPPPASPQPPRTPSTAPATPQACPPTPPQEKATPPVQYSLSACRCLLCKRKYSSQVMLKRHMRIYHKIYVLKNSGVAANAATAANSGNGSAAAPSNSVRVKEENIEPSDDPDSSPAHSPGPAPSPPPRAAAATLTKGVRVKEEAEGGGGSPKSATAVGASSRGGGGVAKTSKLSVGFDFKELFCKLCKRQFSSRQNLTKHIELHTDGTDIFIKFYRCPLCRYESRRKRDVLRHVTVVHKKAPAYLAKIMPKLESRAVKRPAETVLNSAGAASSSSSSSKRAAVKEEVNGRHSPPPPSPPVTRKQELLLLSASSAAVTRKQQEQQHHHPAPPLTRRGAERQDPPPPATRRQEALQEGAAGSSTEVRVTKNFSLHACDVCGRAFAKKLYLESHKRSHRNAEAAAAATAAPEGRSKGVSTRSKALLW